jgi:hypothetical protein
MINGVHLFFIIPPVALVITALGFGLQRFSTRGAKAALVSVVRVMVYGGFILFVLFLIWFGLYYAGGGH